MKRMILSVLSMFACLAPLTGYSQKTIKTYYDYQKQHVHEIYTTDNYGTKNGVYTEYSEYGGVLTAGTFKNGTMVGKWIGKDDKGKIQEEVTYDNDGKYNGQRNRYVDGYKYAEENYRHGVPCGHWKTWFGRDGGSENTDTYGVFLKADGTTQLRYDEYYKPCAPNYEKRVCLEGYDLDSTKKEYNLQGVLISKINYKLGLKNGKATYYDIDGSGDIMQEGTYQNDTVVGEWKTTWDNHGRQTWKKSDASYYKIKDYGKSGTTIFKVTNYYMSGVKENEGAFVENIGFVGHYTEYNKNGQISLIGKYNNNGMRDSTWNWFSASGKDSITINYVNGEDREKAKLEKHIQDSANEVANKKQRREDSLTAISNKKQQDLMETQNELSRQPWKIDSLYKVFTGIYTGSKKSAFLIDPRTHQPLVSKTYPKGKHLYEKADTLFKSWNKEYKTQSDADLKVTKGRNIIALLIKLDGMASADTDDLDKQMKKADTNEDIEKVLGL